MCTTDPRPSLRDLHALVAEGRFPQNGWNRRLDLADLVGKICVAFDVSPLKDRVALTFLDGTVALMDHAQDCCEQVTVEDINGDPTDLLGTPLLVCEERVSQDTSNVHESSTWTFYTLRTLRGSVDVRWLGVSNGYYSESVDVTVRAPDVPPTQHQQLAALRDLLA